MAPSANATLDMEMPAGDHDNLLPLYVRLGKVAEPTVRAMAQRVLTQMYAFGMFDAGYAPANGSLAAPLGADADERQIGR